MATGIPEGGFRDEVSLKTWLGSLPDADRIPFAQIIAHRTAMRVLPCACLNKDFDVALAVLRANTTLRMALKFPADNISTAAAIAGTYSDAAIQRLNQMSQQQSQQQIQQLEQQRSMLEVQIREAQAAAIDHSDRIAVTDRLTASLRANASAAGRGAQVSKVVDAGRAAGAAALMDTASALKFASLAATRRTSDPALMSAIEHDARVLARLGVTSLVDAPLWSSNKHSWWTESWQAMQRALVPHEGAGSEFWQVWLDWYSARSMGETPWGLSETSAEQLELRIALGDGRDDFWGSKENPRGAEAVNAEIAKWVDAARVEAVGTNEKSVTGWGAGAYGEAGFGGQPDSSGPLIPKPKPASLRPKWEDQVLAVDTGTVATSDGASPTTLLSAFRSDFQDFCEDIRGDNSGFIAYGVKGKLERIADMIPDHAPDIETLIRLTQREAFLFEYMPTVNESWPKEHAADYRVLALRLTKILNQFPDSEQFSRSANNLHVSAQDVPEIAEDVRAFANQLREPSASAFVDPTIPDKLEVLAKELEQHSSPDNAVVNSGRSQQLITYDAVQSMDNTLAQIAEKGEEWRPASDGRQAYEQGFSDEYVTASRDAGAQDGRTAARWANRMLVGKTIIQAIGFKLARKYPKIFGWFEKYMENRTARMSNPE